ncbi:hypothetical protein BDQ12DRAFT_662812 [Crucibulum laeve]|uniref:Uncharacterized protein n=1 Tax=Crucibulum laeve TaxID=68775 RepID=A0A5C3MDX2_9AGAR|nr:hypothetical protein BDQ12DRAFT_662812 [Crucibulum laeve]
MNPGLALSSVFRISSSGFQRAASRCVSSSLPARSFTSRPVLPKTGYRTFSSNQFPASSNPNPPTTTEKSPTAAFDGLFMNFVDNAMKRNMPVESAEETWAKQSVDAASKLSMLPPTGPYSGRSVNVYRGQVGDAFRSLDGILTRNKVRQQLRAAERHEKRGAKQRRLSSERWRKQFANEVRKKVQLVIKIRNRGA